MTLVKIIGGHGRVAQLIAQKLAAAPGVKVESIIRKSEQAAAIEKLGAKPVVFDVTTATPEALHREFENAQFVVWAAGAGAGRPPTAAYDIDRDGCNRVVDALRKSPTLQRFIIISTIGTDYTSDLSESFGLYHYYHAKLAAEQYVEKSGVPYTILGPGWLSDKPGTGKIETNLPRELADVRAPNPRQVSRSNVAETVATLVTNPAALKAQLNRKFELLDGDEPIAEALSK